MKGFTNSNGLFPGAVSQVFTATIGTTWTGSEAPFTQTVSVSGLLASDRPVVDIIPAETFATAENELDAWAAIYKITTADGSITAYAAEKTETAINIQMVVIRR